MTKRLLLSVVLACWLGTSVGCVGSFAKSGPAAEYDPVTEDPPRFDSSAPPRSVETRFRVDGAAMNAMIYEAQGAGPHPTVVLLHGFPGNEKNGDLAQAIRRAGWNTILFHYRGSWGSDGHFSFDHVLEDVAGVLQTVRERDFAREHRIDPAAVVLVGHSMGGFAALISAAEDEGVRCVASIAGANLGGLGRAIETKPRERARFAALLDSWSGPLDGPEGRVLVDELIANQTRLDLIEAAPRLAGRPVLLIAGERDQVTPAALHHAPLVDALAASKRAAGSSPPLSHQLLPDADHSFSGQRIALARVLTVWLSRDCRARS